MGKLDRIKEFYDVDNLVTVEMELPEWEALKAAEPRGSTGYQGHRYDWHKATSITISGTKFPKKPHTFKDVGVIKKSYWGSFDKEKPSMRVDFTRFDKKLEDPIEDLIGTERLTLNNCKQDPGYLRQPLCYEIFRMAEVPFFRCNFVKVIVNGTDMGLYVNLEPFRKPYLKRNFDNDKGNAYELDFGQDINVETIDAGLSHEGFSKFDDRKDVRLAAKLLKEEGLAGMKKAFDWDAFKKFWAMEVIVKHRDGYTPHQNNSFAYNDVEAVAEPTEKDLNFKFIPSGVDMTFGKDPVFWMATRAVCAKVVIADEAATKEVVAQIQKYVDTVFSAESYKKHIDPFITRLEEQMKAAGVNFDDTVKNEIKIARSSVESISTQAINFQRWDG